MKPDIDVIKNMLHKSREKLKTACLDYQHARYDDSVSRSYYAVYHALSAVLFAKGLHFSSHAQTIGAFNKEFIKTKEFPASFTKLIEKLFMERQAGDYDFESQLDSEIAEADLNAATEIVTACAEHLAKTYNVPQDFWQQ